MHAWLSSCLHAWLASLPHCFGLNHSCTISAQLAVMSAMLCSYVIACVPVPFNACPDAEQMPHTLDMQRTAS